MKTHNNVTDRVKRAPLRLLGGLGLAGVVLTMTALAADNAAPQASASMSELMTRIVQPTSDAVFYVSRTPPQSDDDWRQLENKTLMLAESANLLLIPGYLRDQDQWIRDSLLMRDAAVAAYKAAQAKDLPVLEELNNALYESCENCHMATR